MEKEIWKDIPNFDGYQASNLGDIRNKKTKKILKPVINRYGYKIYSLFGKKVKGHRLIAKTFISNPNNFSQVNHKDENKQNNNINNLEWCNNKYNSNYGTRNKRIALKNNKPVIQLTKNNIILNEYDSIRIASKILNLQETHIKDVCKGYRKTCGGYSWRYKNESIYE